MLLREDLQVGIDLGEVVRGVEEVDDADQEARSRSEVRGLPSRRNNNSWLALRFCSGSTSCLATYITSLLLEHEELVDAFLNLAILHRGVSCAP